jgi:hypothetical protein
MMEAPDSPPDTQSVSASSQPFSAQQPTSQSSGGSRSNTEAKLNHGAPGSSWNNKKFYEEYERVYAQVIDQSWDNSEFSSRAHLLEELGTDGLDSQIRGSFT